MVNDRKAYAAATDALRAWSHRDIPPAPTVAQFAARVRAGQVIPLLGRRTTAVARESNLEGSEGQ